MKWFLSDVHIDHDVLLPVRRGVMGDHPFFKDINAWQTFIIGQINSTINRGDILYLLGDFSFRHAGKFRSQLKSGVQYFLIKGNHDPSWKACEEVWGQGMVKDTMDIQICDARCFLSHYPHAYWPASHRESYHLYGHCHDQREETLDAIWPERRSTEVSPETIYRIWKEIRPVSEIEIFDLLSKRKGHDGVEFYEKKSGVIKPKHER